MMVASLGARIARRLRGCWVGLLVYLRAAFCFGFLYISPLFCRDVLGCRVDVKCEAFGHFEIQSNFCECFVYSNCIFLFYRRNTLGHIGLSYFVQEFSKPQSPTEGYINSTYA